jgi:hypothetical protein
MIRIDEIYNNTFWPWIKNQLPLTRMFFCDPPGDTRPEALLNFGEDITELQYIFFHDQEPIHLDTHRMLFADVVRRNQDLNHGRGPLGSIIVTSEYQSDFVKQACDTYGWQNFYYFFHGWAALDWYRGYNRTWLMPEPQHRNITHSFISANRIIGGQRDHRIMLMYLLLKSKITKACMSFPLVCPAENQSVVDLSAKFGTEVQETFRNADLPLCFPNETGHPMHSCWLSLFEEHASSLAHVVTETVFYGKRHHLTEKIFKPICLRVPFILVSSAGSLEYLRRYGFRTFSHLWDEYYDLETDDQARLISISRLLKDLDNQSPRELQSIYRAAMPVLEHNYQHFYGGGFEAILWQELVKMLAGIKNHIHAH